MATTPSTTPEPAARPPVKIVTPGQWLRVNLFSNAWYSALTVVFGSVLALAGFRAIRFVFFSGQFEIVRRNLALFMVGGFPRDELWRPWTALLIVAGIVALRSGAAAAGRRRLAAEIGADAVRLSWRGLVAVWWPPAVLGVVLLILAETIGPAWLLLVVVAAGTGAYAAGKRLPAGVGRWMTLLMIVGFAFAVQVVVRFGGVGWDLWGGLMLTLFLAAAGIVLSFPLGVLLALGRRSSLPAVRAVSVGYIELIRGVPLITLLFMGAFAIGFFLPPGIGAPSRVTRAIIAITLFTAAYMAEIVRGGLQSVPKGQIEAAQALGLSPIKTLRLVVLPQALRAVIPAIVGQFISLYKDTSLVAIIGLTDLLRIAQRVTAQPEFIGQGLHAETLTFASFIYWVGAYSMSRASQRLEKRLGVGER